MAGPPQASRFGSSQIHSPHRIPRLPKGRPEAVLSGTACVSCKSIMKVNVKALDRLVPNAG